LQNVRSKISGDATQEVCLACLVQAGLGSIADESVAEVAHPGLDHEVGKRERKNHAPIHSARKRNSVNCNRKSNYFAASFVTATSAEGTNLGVISDDVLATPRATVADFNDDGTPFMKKERFDSLDQLFTKCNLRAVAMLYEAIEAESSPQLRKFLLGAFTSIIHLCTRMMPVGNPAESDHYTYFSSSGSTQHSYRAAPRFMEQNVWDKFEGPSLVIKA
jgi:hypothetical protein